ncbi:MAG: PQQ-binding-like beta-propeller repeat protein [Pirellulales bacterium]
MSDDGDRGWGRVTLWLILAALAVDGSFNFWWVSREAQAAEPHHSFRSDQGVAVEDTLPLPSDLSKPEVLRWRTPLGAGHSTPCISGDSIYLTTFEENKLATVALDRVSGQVRWRAIAPATRLETFHPTGSPAAASCACDGQRVFSFFGSYGLLCYDLSGKLIWSKPLGPFQDEFGSASSPVLVDDVLLLNEDHDVNSFLLCVDAATGETRWQARRDGFTRSYATPLVRQIGGRKQVIVAGALQLVAYDLADGKQLWSVDGLARIVNTTPVFDSGMLFVSTWSPGGDTDARIGMEPWDVAVKQWDVDKDGKLKREEVDNKDVLDRFYRIDLNQDKSLDKEEWAKYARVFELARNSLLAIRLDDNAPTSPLIAWQYEKGLPYVPSPLVYRGVLYLIKDGGILTTFEAATGKVGRTGRMRASNNYYASPAAGDGRVYFVSDPGLLTVCKAGAAWEILSTHDLKERTVASPVIVGGKIYVRTESAVYCFGNP